MTVTANPSPLSEAITLKRVVDDLLMNDPRFTGYARYAVNIRFFWSTAIKTACAGHGFIFFNPDFYDSIPEETRKTVVMHEIWHLILKHLERGKNCDPIQHNIAADHVINNSLEDEGFTFDGTDPCKDPKYKGKSTEQVYNEIYEKRDKNQKIPDNHISGEQIEDLIQEALDADGKGKGVDDQAKENEDALDNSGIGSVGGQLRIQLELSNTIVPVLNAKWSEVFEEYLIDPLSGGKRTFMRPNRRQHGSKSGLVLPGRFPKRGHLNRLTHLVFGLDVSGSITNKQKQQFHDACRTIKELLNPEKFTVILWDTRIVFEKTFTDKEKYDKIAVNAGGGTDLKDLYRRAKEINPEALVIFTDLMVGIPPKPDDMDVIWLIPDKSLKIPQNLYGTLYLIPGA